MAANTPKIHLLHWDLSYISLEPPQNIHRNILYQDVSWQKGYTSFSSYLLFSTANDLRPPCHRRGKFQNTVTIIEFVPFHCPFSHLVEFHIQQWCLLFRADIKSHPVPPRTVKKNGTAQHISIRQSNVKPSGSGMKDGLIWQNNSQQT